MPFLRRQWTQLLPMLGVLVAILATIHHPGGILAALVGLVLIGCVLAAVEHAEHIAHRVGDPYGSIILAVAVTVIEAGLIVVLLFGDRGGESALVRDTSFAAAMITCNLIVGLSLVAGSGRRDTTDFNSEGSASALATVVVLVTLAFVVPSYTTSTEGGSLTGPQLAFAAIASLVIYVVFVVTQTLHHRAIFMPVDSNGEPMDMLDGEQHERPSLRTAITSGVFLAVALVAVIVIAKALSEPLTDGVRAAGLPYEAVGVLIALMVLMPESIAAVRSARQNMGQTSLNLAYGSMIACVGLTIPVVVVAAQLLDVQLILGIDALHIVLLGVTFLISCLTVLPGRAVRLDGALHLLVFAAFVWLTLFP